jgi:cysteinyl-tRNA synthetase
MFTCGPSVYQRAHLGNFRTFLFEDILVRYLEYLNYNVKRVLIITDVEDKSIEESSRIGMPLEKLTKNYINIFTEDSKILKLKPPTHSPTSSTSIHEAADLIIILLEKKFAYWYNGNIYLDPLKCKEFGKLAKLDMKTWPNKKRRFHKDTYPDNRWNRGDFVLWHGYAKGDKVYWNTILGKGRPAWNVQDAAIATKYLGYSFDIFCGGIDNLARHHDYTIAVVCGISREKLSKYWLHGNHLLVERKKMSKSKGNIIYTDDLLKQGYSPEDIRFFLIHLHYRTRLNFTYAKFKKTISQFEKMRQKIKIIRQTDKFGEKPSEKVRSLLVNLQKHFERGMNHDLDVETALESLFQHI